MATDLHLKFHEFWIKNNISFLNRFWSTAREALDNAKMKPEEFEEFRNFGTEQSYVESVIENHLDNHAYSGVLLSYANLEEFLIVLTQVLEVRIRPKELRDGGVRRYKTFIHKVCRISEQDLASIRNAIVHANGNASLMGDRKKIESVVNKHSPDLEFKHDIRLVVADNFVMKSFQATKDSALSILELMINSNMSLHSNGESAGASSP